VHSDFINNSMLLYEGITHLFNEDVKNQFSNSLVVANYQKMLEIFNLMDTEQVI